MLDSQATSAAIYKQLFTGAEWDAIAFAMKDYGDFHGGMDETIANNVQAKIAKIFELTADWFFHYCNIIMTITERNQKLFDLRKQLDQKKMECAWIETQIMAVNSQYDRENRDTPLFDEMFGGW